jgi:hypothetical protein
MADAGLGVMVELRNDPPRNWDVSRTRCSMFAVGIPVALIAATALALAFALPPVEGGEEANRRLAEVIAWVLVAVFIVLAVREYVVLALFGGGLTAAPVGLEFRWGRRTMLFPWSIVQGAAVESRSSGRGSYDVLAIGFLGTGYRWPRAFSLWFTKPTCLCISPMVLARPARQIATELEVAQAQFAQPAGAAATGSGPQAAGVQPAYTDQRSQASLDRGRMVKGGLGAAGSFLVAAFSVAVAVSAVDDPELSVGGSLLVAVIMSVVGVGSLAYARGGGRG